MRYTVRTLGGCIISCGKEMIANVLDVADSFTVTDYGPAPEFRFNAQYPCDARFHCVELKTQTSPHYPPMVEASYVRLPTLQQFVKYAAKEQRQAEIDNPWHTELRERYTLEPKMAAWKGILLIAAWCFAVNCIISLYRHLEPCAYVIALVVSAVFAPIWYFVFFWLPDKIIRWAKAS